ncbi:hypothetical protein SB89_00980 [Corynebacterium glutamicum]|nr:hypothetical protein SB89_00980 [Corynebacterium glutamicum]
MMEFLNTHRLIVLGSLSFLGLGFAEVLLRGQWSTPQFFVFTFLQTLLLVLCFIPKLSVPFVVLLSIAQLALAYLCIHGEPQSTSPFTLIVAQMAFSGLLMFKGQRVLAFISAGGLIWIGTIDPTNGAWSPHVMSALALAVFFALSMALGQVLRSKVEQRANLEEQAKIQTELRRKELALHLHRSVAKELTFAVMKSQELSGRDNLSTDVKKQLYDIEESARKALMQTHDLMKSLQTFDQLPYVPELDRIPLHVVLNVMKADLEDLGFTMLINTTTFNEDLSAENVEAIVTVLEEASNNIAKYADKSEPVQLSIARVTEEIHLSIRNKVQQVPGNLARAASSGIGLIHMRHAVESVGGNFSVNENDSMWIINATLKNPSPVPLKVSPTEQSTDSY